MNQLTLAALAAGLAVAACSGPAADREQTTPAAAAPRRDSAVAAPADHSMHAMADSTAAAGAAAHDMAGMDHGAPAGGGADPHAAMGHGAAPARGRSARPATADPHAGMRHGMGTAPRAAPGGHAAMDHAAMGHVDSRPMDTGGTTSTRDLSIRAVGGAEATADERLLLLAAELMKDPAVQREVQQDTALRRRWEDPAVRRVLRRP